MAGLPGLTDGHTPVSMPSCNLTYTPKIGDQNRLCKWKWVSETYTGITRTMRFVPHRILRTWVQHFVQWYNGTHRHSGLKFVTPNERHEGQDNTILANRKAVYEAAKKAHPERWSGATRDWRPVGSVWLNPTKHEDDKDETVLAQAA
jgi:putative transposase